MLETKRDGFLKVNLVLSRIGVSRPTLYRLMGEGKFPKQIKVGRSALWSENAIDEWIETMKRGEEWNEPR